MSSQRRIAHLDMDAFFASVELLRYPELRGRPVVIGGRGQAPKRLANGQWQFATLKSYVGRGVVTTATYEARAFGVHSAMGMMKAARLAPQAIMLPVDFVRYREYSRRFKEAVRRIAPKLEDRGIDEIYLDLTDLPGQDVAIATSLKNAVFEATGLTCSIAIAPNKLLAKIGSDLDKPDGLTILSVGDIPSRVWPLAVSEINGIGPKSTKRLKNLGIETIGQLAAASPTHLQAVFGTTYARWLLDVSRGIDNSPVKTHSDPKSISRETTFERDLHVQYDRQLLTAAFDRLCEQIEADLSRKGCKGRTVGVKLRYENFETVTRDLTLPEVTQDIRLIRRTAVQCLRRAPLDQRLRLLGIRVSNLICRDSDDSEDSYGDGFPKQLSLL